MEEMAILGYVIVALGTIGSFVVLIYKFTQPINDLRVVIQELKDCVKTLKEDRDHLKKRVEKHGAEIDVLKGDVKEIKTKMELYHKE